MAKKTEWYKNAIVYQIYPFSFLDSDNDGWGDIEGIISKLDYIKDLGATAIWISPLYKSPDHDFGYDISDYRDIDEKFGTMADFDRLLEEIHKRGMKLIMDMVLNHTSMEHPWFKEALSSKDSPYRDYYIIREGKREKGKLLPPTNWDSCFTGSAWSRIGETDEFYLHLFAKEQPDLNWENPRVREEIVSILNFWLDKGVDGFRFDVFNLYSKVYPLQDDKGKSTQKGSPYFIDGPRMHEFLKELNEKSLSLYDCFTVGESYLPSKQDALNYVREENHELDSIFDFAHLEADNIGGLKFFPKPFDLRQFKRGLFDPQKDLYGIGWNTLVLENHDTPRSVSRFGLDSQRYRYEAASMLATLTYMGFGIPFIYQGQEAGLKNSRFNSLEEMRDPVSHFVHDLMHSYGMPKKLARFFIQYGARDHARVPMAWNGSVNGGFNAGTMTWQSVHPDYRENNVEKDMNSEKSVYRFYQKLLALKKTDEVLIYGKTEEIDHNNRRIVAYYRIHGEKKRLIIANFSKHTTRWNIPEWAQDNSILLNNLDQIQKDGRKLKLLPYQALVLEVK